MLHLALALFFIIGYIAIIFENYLHINKAAVALVMAVICWLLYFADNAGTPSSVIVAERMYDVAQVIFFLLAVMVIIELIDSHHGFKLITDLIYTSSKRRMFWFILLLAFFMSAILDNLTSMLVMLSLLRKMVHTQKDRWVMGSLVVLAVNAGGAWTPIGDVTTTMLWIHELITTSSTIQWLFLPSLANLIASGLIAMFLFKGHHPKEHFAFSTQPMAPGAKYVFFLGLGSLIMIPVWKALFDLPPFMGALIALGLIWLFTDLMHLRFKEERWHLRVVHVMTKIDMSGLLFFLGILLAIDALGAAGLLQTFATALSRAVHSEARIAVVIGFLSSVIDNVPLVAAMIGMYGVETFPQNSPLWQLTAYAAGTGGSLLIIGSAAGIVFMGMEKVNFMWYCKHISWIALVGYLSGLCVYFLQQSFMFS